MTNYTLIDTAGQLTAIIDQPTPIDQQPILGQRLLRQSPSMGQVAFTKPKLRMMGGEFSINGTIAAKYFLKKYTLPKRMSVAFPNTIIKQVRFDEVIFPGIKYKLFNNQQVNTFIASAYCGKDQACGFIFEEKPGEIIPIVYVKATNTLNTETACGSASLAYSILKNINTVTQPSKKTISIKKTRNQLIVTTVVKLVTDSSINNPIGRE